MPSFQICTHVAGYAVEAPDQDTAVAALSGALAASPGDHPTFAHEIVIVEEIDPTDFDFEDAHLVDGPEDPPITNLPDGVKLTHWSRDPVEEAS